MSVPFIHVTGKDFMDTELSTKEREMLMKLFERFSLFEKGKDRYGRPTKRRMRQRIIWIDRLDFLKSDRQHRLIQSLLDKGLLQPHIIGYKISIKAEYLDKIYNLAESQQGELIKQLAPIWIDTN